MKEFGLQIYSVRDYFTNKEDTKTAFKELAKMGYKSVQTAGTYDYIAPEEFYKLLSDAGLYVCGTHYSFDKIIGDVPGTIKYHEALGTKNIGLGGMPMEYRNSEEGVLKFIEAYNEAANVYAKHGFKLNYHNHSFEFIKLESGKCVFDHMIEKFNENVSFVIDTFWLQYAGVDVRVLLEGLAGSIDILHLKDMSADRSKLDVYPYPMVAIGEGNLNFKGIIECAEAAGVKHFVVEDDRCFPGESLKEAKKSADYIKENLLEK